MERFFWERDFVGSASPRSPDGIFRNLHFDWDSYTRRFVI